MPDLSRIIIGVSPEIVALRNYLPKVARSNATVLITGATGTGKDLVAGALHRLGARRHRPLVAINCAAVPESLVESELFGHERGAFTGAIGSSKGHIIRSDGGTLYLDEIGEMSLYMQAKLLRMIETREVMPIGADRAMPVDIRIIAATNQPLENLVESKRFRTDLYYRLNVARLELPSLKDRKEDIPLLLEKLIVEMNQREQCTVGLPEEELLDCLLTHDWPGNIRELRNFVEAVFIDPPRGRITLDDLPPVFKKIFADYKKSISNERQLLLKVLKQTQWNKSEAAKLLNLSRMTLYRKLSKYQIE